MLVRPAHPKYQVTSYLEVTFEFIYMQLRQAIRPVYLMSSSGPNIAQLRVHKAHLLESPTGRLRVYVYVRNIIFRPL
jgi:hypothetical protein